MLAWEWDRDRTKGHKETFRGDPYVHSLDCGDDFTGVFIY